MFRWLVLLVGWLVCRNRHKCALPRVCEDMPARTDLAQGTTHGIPQHPRQTVLGDKAAGGQQLARIDHGVAAAAAAAAALAAAARETARLEATRADLAAPLPPLPKAAMAAMDAMPPLPHDAHVGVDRLRDTLCAVRVRVSVCLHL